MAVTKITDADSAAFFASHQTVLIKYYADWCGNCKLITPKFNRLSEDERFHGIAFAETNAEENPELRKLAGVTNLPFFAVIKEGKLVSGHPTSLIDAVEKLAVSAL